MKQGMFKRGVLLLCLLLCACGGGGGGGGGSSPAPVDSGPAPSKVFVAYTVSSPFSAGVASVANPNPSAGTLAIDRTITGPATGTSGVAAGSLFLDAANNRLYVIDFNTIRVFNNASTANGNIAPNRSITISGATQPFRSLFVDTINDILYVAEPSKIWVFNNASTLNGLSTPSRSITGNFGGGGSNEIGAISVDVTRNILYVSIQYPGTRLASFNGASTLNGTNLTPSRIIDYANTAGSVSQAFGLFADSANDRIYVTHSASPGILVFNGASTANGTLTPNRTIIVGASIKNIAVNTAADRLYGVTNSTVYVVNNVSTAVGAISAAAVFAPAGSSIMSIAVVP